MDLHEVFVFLLNFDEKIPQTFLMWLDNYSKLEQDSFVSIVMDQKVFKMKQKIKKNNHDHKAIHMDGCQCNYYYQRVSDMVSFPYSLIGKCIKKQKISVQEDTKINCSYAETIIPARMFHECASREQTQKVYTRRFRVFPNYERKDNTINVYSLLTLLKREDFDFFSLTRYLDVIEIATIYLMVDGMFGIRFIENFLPIYCRSLRYVTGSRDVNRNILSEIYDKFYNRNLRMKFPDTIYVSLSLRPIKVCKKVPSNFETIQLGYIGERFVMHVTKKKMYVMNDFGEYLGVYSQYEESPFGDETDCVFECIDTSDLCYVVDIYVFNRISVYDELPRVRSTILMSINLNDSVKIKKAPFLNDFSRYMDMSDLILNNGYNKLLYDSLIFRSADSSIKKYILPKNNLVFDVCGSIKTMGFGEGFSSKYSGTFLVKFESDNSWSVNVWDRLSLVDVGRIDLPMSFFDNKKKFFVVKVYFNCIIDNKIQEIVSIVKKKYKSVYNCISFCDLPK